MKNISKNLKESLDNEKFMNESLRKEINSKNEEINSKNIKIKELSQTIVGLNFDKQNLTDRVKVLEEEKNKQLEDLIKNSNSGLIKFNTKVKIFNN
jgi:uncharacterized protein YoxC